MQIKDLFVRPVGRPINGVIKADQNDDKSVWQELDEYVVTKELDDRLRKFFEFYLASVDNPNDPDVVSKVGVWVSGFFGSGKSHFIKILSYLLENKEVTYDAETKQAIEFFDDKIQDAILAADIKRAVNSDVDVILFNIDSKADSNDERSILRAFLKVFNEKLGFCSDFPHIAHMERYLSSKGQFDEFKRIIEAETGDTWEEIRIEYQFNADDIAKALTQVTGQDIKDADAWLERFETDFSLSVENFAKWVKEYLDSKGSNHRIIFLVDEIGQFIGQNTQLMLNLQTIVENLGTKCLGRAWVSVTSQEDIDAVLGEVIASKANDFSKIQGRFRRLSLSSANVDEVIQKRLLSKVPEAKEQLGEVYREKADILRHQLSFTNTGMTFKAYSGEEDFVAVYPFAPYQFQLVQKIFESIRKAGATGLHLAKGERSMLDAFQSAAKQVADEKPGILVPLYRFYPAIESFLEGAVKATIDHSADNVSLEPFDGLVLKTLFLIRYVEEIKGNVDNLITLFIDEIDADRRVLRDKIEASLQRLEGQTLINRNGEDYFFLTNEERDISREIQDVELNPSEEARFLGDIIFQEILHGIGRGKYRYPETNKDFDVKRICDQHPFGSRLDGDLTLNIVTPLSEDYSEYNESSALMRSNDNGGQVIVLLDNDKRLAREVRTYLQTDNYGIRKSDGTQSPSFMKILREFQEENRERRDRIESILDDLIKTAKVFVAGQVRESKVNSSSGIVDAALKYLVQNTFNYLGHLQHPATEPQREIKSILFKSPDDESLDLGEGSTNAAALNEVLQYITLASSANRQIILFELVDEKFSRRPYGWQEWDVILLVVRLVMAGEISLVADGSTLSTDKIYQAIDGTNKWRKIKVVKRKTVDKGSIQTARKLARKVFGKMPADGEDALARDLRQWCSDWQDELRDWGGIQKAKNYPGATLIADVSGVINKMAAIQDTYEFIEHFISNAKMLEEKSEDMDDLRNFYLSQSPTWDNLTHHYQQFTNNASELLKDKTAQAGMKRIADILQHETPYGMLSEAENLIRTVKTINDALVSDKVKHAISKIDGHINRVKLHLDEVEASADLRNKCLRHLQNKKAEVEKETSIAHIFKQQQEASDAADSAIDEIQHVAEEAAKAAAQQAKKENASNTPATASTASQNEPTGLGEAPATFNHPTVPAAKKTTKRIRRIKSADLVNGKPYLESKQDVEEFINKLRDELNLAIDNDERVEIR